MELRPRKLEQKHAHTHTHTKVLPMLQEEASRQQSELEAQLKDTQQRLAEVSAKAQQVRAHVSSPAGCK